MRTRGLLAAALLVGGACSSGGESASTTAPETTPSTTTSPPEPDPTSTTAAPTSTTAAPTTTTSPPETTEPPAPDEFPADRDAYIDALLVDAPAPTDDFDPPCIVAAIVDEIGYDTLAARSITPDELFDAASFVDAGVDDTPELRTAMADMWKACTSLGQAAVEAVELLGLAIDDATSDCFIAGMTDVMAEAQAGSIIAGEVFADTELIIDASAIGARCGAAALTIRPGGDVTIADGAALFVDALTAQLAATDDPADFGFVDSEAECFAGGVVDAIGSDDIAASGVNAGQLGLYLRQALSPTDLGIELDVDQLDALTVLFLNCVDYFRIQAEAGSGAATELGLADPEAIEQMIDCMRELADPDLVPAEIRLRFEYGLDAFEQDAFRDILATWIDLGFQCAVVPEVQPFVGLAYDIGGTGDGTFNDAAAAGAARAADELGVEVFELQADTVSQRGVVLRNLTDSGASPIVANGFGFSVALEDVAWRNPFTQYAIVDGVIPNAPPNVTFISFAEHEGSFLVGAAAALHCGCETIGFIGGQNIDVINRFLAGYTAGAEYIDPDINVRVRYLGFASDATAWSSPDEAHQIAAAWYDEGVEVIFSAAGASGEGTRRAAAESDAWAIGVDSDEWVIAPEEQRPHILTSMLKRIDVAVYDIYASSLDGTLSGGFRVYDLAAGGVGYARSGDHLADHYDTLDQIDQQIRDGDIIVPDSL